MLVSKITTGTTAEVTAKVTHKMTDEVTDKVTDKITDRRRTWGGLEASLRRTEVCLRRT